MIKYFASIVIVFTLAGISQAQMTKDPGGIRMPPGRSIHAPVPVDTKSYPDSAKFVAAFKEFYPEIKPTPGVRERAEQALQQQMRMFKSRGVDSAAAYDSVMKKIDVTMDEKILFDSYRREFTADELKSVAAFFKSPAGKHYLEVEGKLTMARDQTTSYVKRTIQSAVQPMMKPMERPFHPGQPGAPGAAPGQTGLPDHGPHGMMNGHPMPNRMPPPQPAPPDSASH